MFVVLEKIADCWLLHLFYRFLSKVDLSFENKFAFLLTNIFFGCLFVCCKNNKVFSFCCKILKTQTRVAWKCRWFVAIWTFSGWKYIFAVSWHVCMSCRACCLCSLTNWNCLNFDPDLLLIGLFFLSFLSRIVEKNRYTPTLGLRQIRSS